jgi:hypothetical protein
MTGSHRFIRRGVFVKQLLILGLLCVAPASAQAQARITVSGAPMLWRADLFGSLAAVSTESSNRALGLTLPVTSSQPSNTRKRIVLRAIKTAAFDLPVVWFFVSWNHEYGHVARATEAGIDVRLQLVGTPWTYPRFELEPTSIYPRLSGERFDLAAESGGLEASWVMKDRLEREARVQPLTAGAAIAAIWATLSTPLYVQVNSPDSLFQEATPSGDVARYAWQWIRNTANRDPRAAPERLASLRSKSLISLVDAGLLQNGFGILHDYVWQGSETVKTRSLSIHGVQVSPSLRYALTPIGPETSIRTYLQVARSRVYVYYRTTAEGPATEANGSGFELGRSLNPRWDSSVALDFWTQSGARGSRQELSLRMKPNPDGRTFVELVIEHKTTGYVQGRPLRAGLFVSGTLGLSW